MSTQVCSKCGEEKDITEFPKTGKICKICIKIINSERYKKNSEKIKAQQKKYRESHKTEIKNRMTKYREVHYTEILLQVKTYYSEHKEQNKTYREENKDKIALQYKKYGQSEAGKLSNARKLHKRRSLLKQTSCTLTLLQWEKILDTQGNKCAICGKRFCKSRPPTKDHIVPLSKGGGLTFENVQALCHSCNSSKNASLDHTKIITWSHHGITT